MDSTQTTPKKGEKAPKKRPLFSKWSKDFLDALREFGVVSYAAEIAGVNRTAAYKAKNRNKTFSDRWNDAIEEAADKLEQEARRRAVEGTHRLQFYKGRPIMVPLIDEDGKPVYEDMIDMDGQVIIDDNGRPRRQLVMVPYVEHEYSDTLLIFLMKCWRPQYRDSRVELSTKDGRPLVQQNNFATISDDELYDAFTGAMAQLAAQPAGTAGNAGGGAGQTQTGTDTDPITDGAAD